MDRRGSRGDAPGVAEAAFALRHVGEASRVAGRAGRARRPAVGRQVPEAAAVARKRRLIGPRRRTGWAHPARRAGHVACCPLDVWHDCSRTAHAGVHAIVRGHHRADASHAIFPVLCLRARKKIGGCGKGTKVRFADANPFSWHAAPGARGRPGRPREASSSGQQQAVWKPRQAHSAHSPRPTLSPLRTGRTRQCRPQEPTRTDSRGTHPERATAPDRLGSCCSWPRTRQL